MTDLPHPVFAVFDGHRLVARGSAGEAAVAIRRAQDAGGGGPVLAFDNEGRPADFDVRGSEAEILARHAQPPAEPRGRGRPKLGVTAREVTLMPRHWDWLATQPGGASVALRKLVEAARGAGEGRVRAARDAAYRFMSAIGGDLPGFEEAARALFASDPALLRARVADWPADIRNHLLELMEPEALPV